MATKNKVKRFAPKLHVRKGDSVMVMAGDDKGKTGQVLQVFPDKNRAIVEGVNIVKKHVKATQNEEGGIQEMEATIHMSNLALLDPKTGEPTRIGRREENGVSVRYSKKTGNVIK
ncbi:MAG: 50S ribosomal protein L24 [Haliscomenobacteraceae bacterium CHB4]|nr:50S ribosomal protein L24 [Saprospiraceae bacterium]MCE7925374.1 50S ribosomal protein L24 [Haliscomenobacteraceae bacterium CHB4]